VTIRPRWFYAAIIAVLALMPASWALYSQTFGILARDHGIFMYVAWALRQGEHAYRDIHEINGPLPHAYYMLLQALGGEDEHRFRVLDTLLIVAVYIGASMTLPRWIGLKVERAWEHAVWAAAGVAALGTQYVRYDWWHSGQREALYAVLVYSSLAVQSIGHTTRNKKLATRMFFLAGIATALPWFGKPPCAIFTVFQIAVLIYDRKTLPIAWKRAVVAAIVGAVVVGLAMLGFLLVFADISRGIALMTKVPNLHHTIWNETIVGSYKAFHNGPTLDWAAVSFVSFLAAYRLFKLPRVSLLALVLPVGGFIVFAGQGKAFPYHLHMLTLGTAIAQLVVIGAFARRPEPWVFAGGTILSLLLGFKSANDSIVSPSIHGKWAKNGATAPQRESRAYFDRFPWGDYFPNDMRDAAAFLQVKTFPSERVQIYGFDPYFLFLSRRLSASPVIYGFELNVDAALKGGPGAKPSPELKDWLVQYRDDAENLVLTDAEAQPPAAFAMFDRAPFTFPPDATRDFEEHCPKLYKFLQEHRYVGATFGTIHLMVRPDVMAR
jgi:hypothetical protein